LATRRHDDGIRVEERLRIAQDLHDGTQQQLVAILIEVELAKGKSLDPGVQSLLATLSARVNEVIDSIRELASHGAPALLEERGLEEALVAAAERMPVPTVVRCRGVARYTPEVEKAVYFSCLEAMQNAEKHADEAAHVTVELAERDSELRFVVTDDGCGFDAYATPAGAGLTNITARMYAVGGGSAIDSRRGCGSTVMGWAFV
jgi:signal transduction histidine kinase